MEETSKVFLRNPYNYDMDIVSYATGVQCVEPTKTQQQFKDECDINTILKRFNATGELPVRPVTAAFSDFSEVFDFQSAMNQIVLSRMMFNELPAKTRDYFRNDPQRLLVFLEDPANREEGERLGLIEKRKPPEGLPTAGGDGAPPKPGGAAGGGQPAPTQPAA
ncbi:MAG: internal scaffolding protein [Microvirus sp.]|nr:MAG: internal scaffolding protein [Microvirus sp.]